MAADESIFDFDRILLRNNCLFEEEGTEFLLDDGDVSTTRDVRSMPGVPLVGADVAGGCGSAIAGSWPALDPNPDDPIPVATSSVAARSRPRPRPSLRPLPRSTSPPAVVIPIVPLPSTHLPAVLPAISTTTTHLHQHLAAISVSKPTHLLPRDHPAHPKLQRLPSIRPSSSSTGRGSSSNQSSSTSYASMSTSKEPTSHHQSKNPVPRLSFSLSTSISRGIVAQSTPRIKSMDDMFERRRRDSYMFNGMDLSLSDLGAEFDIPSVAMPPTPYVSRLSQKDGVDVTEWIVPGLGRVAGREEAGEAGSTSRGLLNDSTQLTRADARELTSPAVFDDQPQAKGEGKRNRRTSRVVEDCIASTSNVLSSNALPLLPNIASRADIAVDYALTTGLGTEAIEATDDRRRTQGFAGSVDRLPIARRASRAFAQSESGDEPGQAHRRTSASAPSRGHPSLQLPLPPPARARFSISRADQLPRPPAPLHIIQLVPASHTISRSTARLSMGYPSLARSTAVAARVTGRPSISVPAAASIKPSSASIAALSTALVIPKEFTFGNRTSESRDEVRKKRSEEREKELVSERKEMERKRVSNWGASTSSNSQIARDKRMKLTQDMEAARGLRMSSASGQAARRSTVDSLTLQALTSSGNNEDLAQDEAQKRMAIFLEGVEESAPARSAAQRSLLTSSVYNQYSVDAGSNGHRMATKPSRVAAVEWEDQQRGKERDFEKQRVTEKAETDAKRDAIRSLRANLHVIAQLPAPSYRSGQFR